MWFFIIIVFINLTLLVSFTAQQLTQRQMKKLPLRKLAMLLITILMQRGLFDKLNLYVIQTMKMYFTYTLPFYKYFWSNSLCVCAGWAGGIHYIEWVFTK